MTNREKLLSMIEDDPNDRTLKEIGKELTITPEQVKKIENSIPWHNRGKHKVTFDGKTQTIKGLKFAINFLGHTGEEDIIPVAQKLLDIMKAKSEIKSWKYLNASWLIENNKIYLTNVYLGCIYHNEDEQVIDIYSELFEEDKTFAYWFTDKIPFGKGELWVQGIHPHKTDIFASEIKFEVKKGNVISKKEIDNTKLYKKSTLKMYLEE